MGLFKKKNADVQQTAEASQPKAKSGIVKKIIAGVLTVAVVAGGITLGGMFVKSGRDNEKNLYLSLRYLENGNTELSSKYLDKVSENSKGKVKFIKDAMEIVHLQYAGKSSTLAMAKLDILREEYAGDSKQADICDYLSAGRMSTEGSETIISALINYLDLSEKKTAEYDAHFDIENDGLYGGYLDEERLMQYQEMCGEEEQTYLRLSVALSNGDYHGAISTAAQLVEENPSNANRLLLADVIAQSAHSGYRVSRYDFGEAGAAEADKEIARLEEKIIKAEEKINELEADLAIATKENRIAKLEEKLAEQQAQLREYQTQRENVFVYRAVNSVSDLGTASAGLVKAKLYYAAGDENKAQQTVLDTAESISAKLETNETIKTGLGVVADMYSGNNEFSAGMETELNDVIRGMFENTTPEITVVRQNYNLVKDMAVSMVSDLKYVNNGIIISSVDTSEYPQITAYISAAEEVLKDIVAKNNVTVKDTRHNVEYKAEIEEIAMSSVSFVVDISGSMGGQPIDDARQALKNFFSTMSDETEASLVAFDNEGYITVSLTQDTNQLVAGSQSLNAGGGTDITAGISTGITSLANATGTKTIILMTDGQSDVDLSVVDGAKAAGITIYTIGFGSVNTEILQEIADRTGGQFILATSSGELSSIYSSIGAILSNRAAVKYTITENPDEVDRYCFIKAADHNASDRFTYTLGTTAKTVAENFRVEKVHNPAWSITEINENETISLGFDVNNGNSVTHIEINGEKTEVTDRYSDYVAVDIPTDTLSAGTYTVSFHMADESVYDYENGLLIYDSTVSVFRNSTFYAGTSRIETLQAFLLADGRLFMVNPDFINDNPENNIYAIEVSTDTMIHITAYSPLDMTAYTPDVGDDGIPVYTGEFGLGNSITFDCDGKFYTSGNDASYNYSDSDFVAVGQLSGTLDTVDFTLVKR
ncbi:MAG: VWA domain-containing protein [Oscillospiraceae bacterium]|nr:VWA domain-containing protein [Oscillospiraceae bacterium]